MIKTQIMKPQEVRELQSIIPAWMERVLDEADKAGAMIEVERQFTPFGTFTLSAVILPADKIEREENEEADSDQETIEEMNEPYVHLGNQYDSDCPACLRAISHSDLQHNKALGRVSDSSYATDEPEAYTDADPGL